MSRFSIALAIVLAAVASTSAQIISGDYLLASSGNSSPGLFRLHPSNGVLSPINVGITPFYPVSVLMDADNQWLLTGANDTTGDYLSSVAPNGALTQGTYLTTRANQCILDEDGSVVAAEDWGLYSIDTAMQTENWIWNGLYFFNYGLTLDQDNGDYIVGGVYYLMTGRLMRVHRNGTSQIIATNLGWVSAVDFDPLTGDYLVTNGDAISPLLRVTKNGLVQSMGMNVPTGAKAVKVDPTTGNILVGGTNEVRLLGPTGNLIQNFPLATGMDYLTGLEIYGSRKVSGHGTAAAGTDYYIEFSFPDCPNQPYVAALSTSMRPGFALNDGTGRVISLQNNSIAQLTLGGLPGVIDGFSGTLDAQGHATGVIHLPGWAQPGTRLFVTGVAVNPGMPSNLDTANTWSFSTH